MSFLEGTHAGLGERWGRAACASTRALALLVLLTSSCAAPPPPDTPDEAPRVRGPIRQFSYTSLDTRPVSTEALHGRASIVTFVATYGLASQIQLRYIQKIQSDYHPPVNLVAVFMDPSSNPDNRPIVRIYCDTLHLEFPVAMADVTTVSGKGPFGDVGMAPTTIVLDASGAETWRKTGVADATELTRALRDAQRH